MDVTEKRQSVEKAQEEMPTHADRPNELWGSAS